MRRKLTKDQLRLIGFTANPGGATVDKLRDDLGVASNSSVAGTISAIKKAAKRNGLNMEDVFRRSVNGTVRDRKITYGAGPIAEAIMKAK